MAFEIFRDIAVEKRRKKERLEDRQWQLEDLARAEKRPLSTAIALRDSNQAFDDYLANRNAFRMQEDIARVNPATGALPGGTAMTPDQAEAQAMVNAGQTMAEMRVAPGLSTAQRGLNTYRQDQQLVPMNAQIGQSAGQAQIAENVAREAQASLTTATKATPSGGFKGIGFGGKNKAQEAIFAKESAAIQQAELDRANAAALLAQQPQTLAAEAEFQGASARDKLGAIPMERSMRLSDIGRLSSDNRVATERNLTLDGGLAGQRTNAENRAGISTADRIGARDAAIKDWEPNAIVAQTQLADQQARHELEFLPEQYAAKVSQARRVLVENGLANEIDQMTDAEIIGAARSWQAAAIASDANARIQNPGQWNKTPSMLEQLGATLDGVNQGNTPGSFIPGQGARRSTAIQGPPPIPPRRKPLPQ